MSGSFVLAHQGGWDEFLMVATPIGLFVGLLWLANKRALEAAEAEEADDSGEDPTETSSTEDSSA